MTTQAMYDNGLRCRGKGFNCNGCKDRNDCVEYVNTDVEPKQPLGVTPKDIWEKLRIQELKEAIDRYTKEDYKIPVEWIEEYNELVEKYYK